MSSHTMLPLSWTTFTLTHPWRAVRHGLLSVCQVWLSNTSYMFTFVTSHLTWVSSSYAQTIHTNASLTVRNTQSKSTKKFSWDRTTVVQLVQHLVILLTSVPNRCMSNSTWRKSKWLSFATMYLTSSLHTTSHSCQRLIRVSNRHWEFSNSSTYRTK